jgi:hypothetical protein
MNELLALIAFLANLAFFIWFGATLTGIHDEARRTNALLAHCIEIIRYYGDIATSRSQPEPPPLPASEGQSQT